MQLLDDVVVISATDFNHYLACEYLTTLDLKVVQGELERPTERPGQAELLAKLGDEHEHNYLRRLLAEGRQVSTIERGPGFDGIRRAAAETEAARSSGRRHCLGVRA